jgi:hypothetical protein
MGERIDREELRLLIREALREALGTSVPSSAASSQRESEKARPHAPGPSPSPVTPRKREGKDYRKDSGVLTEATVVAAGKAHTRIVIGNDVAVTPLARDRARELKIGIVRQKS